MSDRTLGSSRAWKLAALAAFAIGWASQPPSVSDRGVLRWSETLAEALPDIAAKLDPAFRTVTLDRLMRHVSGLPTGGAFTPEFTAGFDDEQWPIAKQRASGSNGYNHAEIVVIPRIHAAVLVTVNAGDEKAHAAAKEVADKLVDELESPRPPPGKKS